MLGIRSSTSCNVRDILALAARLPDQLQAKLDDSRRPGGDVSELRRIHDPVLNAVPVVLISGTLSRDEGPGSRRGRNAIRYTARGGTAA